ncbi:MAG: hypothetical protein BGO82_05965 [Devosia sp. 67-54]|uniref:hypothetical protein n=1 Tax=unclassified Devosia TaxID=196773 RepID=UPI0009656026|nr:MULTISPECIES: hypothetical protein [unclassified Devosia]MBN9306836.1 hypothetical protein [Devosia sp.]OJX17058.1 MAG: hypothetical protein BGO82_05965 [Devosia sp. 67-54]
MSLVPRPAPSLFDPNAQAIIDMSPSAEPAAPGALDLIGAAFRQENIVGSILARHRADGTPDPTYNPWADIKDTPYEAHWDRFTGSTNAGETAALKAQIDMEQSDRNTIAAAGGWGMLATLGAGLFSPENLLPAGEIYRSAKGGEAVLRSALSGASYGAMSAALGESALAGSQELRTPQDSAIGIGSAALLGGVLGGGLSAMFSRADFARLAAQMADESVHAVDSGALAANEAAMFTRPGPSSAGAAARPVASLDENSIAGRAAQIAGGAVRNLNPVLRALHSPSAIMRDVATRLFENPVYMKKNLEGVASDPGVETLVKEYTRGAVSKAMEAANAAYGDYRKAGGQMSRGDFNAAVGKAMRRGDTSADPHVTKAATAWRSAVFDPLKQKAIEARLLPADVQPETALSYFTRVYNRPRIEAREAQFKGIVRRYIDRSIRSLEMRRDEIDMGNRIVTADAAAERLAASHERLSRLDARLADRAAVRRRKLTELQDVEQQRFMANQERPPAELARLLRNADQNSHMLTTLREARAARRSAAAKAPFHERSPILAMVKRKGGVRVGSTLDGELRAMGVTPTTHPGLFRSNGGLGRLDNLAWDEEPAIFENLPAGADGYADERAVMDAIREELAGNPLRTHEQRTAEANADALSSWAEEWLHRLGLASDTTVGAARGVVRKIVGAEAHADDLVARGERLTRELQAFDEATEALSSERLISAEEARTAGEEVQRLNEEIIRAQQFANASPAVSIMVDYAKVRRDLFKARMRERDLGRRVEALTAIRDSGRANDAMLADLWAKTEDLTRVGDQVQRLVARVEKLQPKVPKLRQELPEFLNEADRADYISEVVDNIFNSVTGRNVDGDVPRDIVAATRGPLRERTFHIPDSEIEDFLEHDVEAIGRRYARVMASDIELTKAFGRADLRDQIDAVKRQYGDLRRAIEDGIDPHTGEVLAMQLTQRQRLAAVRRLVAREKNDIQDLRALRDMVRGNYLARENSTKFARYARVAGTINFLRTMGGVTLSSLGDVGRTLMVHTLTGTMRDGLIPLMRNLKGFQMSVAEAKTAGAVAERILNTRMATWAEITDPYSVSSPFERFMQNTANGFSHLTGMAYWNDFQKSFASVITQNRVLRGTAHFSKLDHRERAYLAYLGIDGQMAERIAKQFEAHGTTEDGDIRVANSDDWSDEWARRVYRAAINKDVDTTIITKGVGDVPLFFNTPTGRLLGQFKSFTLASHQRALMRGLQERPMGMVSGVLVSTGIGMLIYYLKSVESNRTADLSNNPGRWIAEGLDRSGIFAIAFEANNTIEKAFGIGAYGALAAAFPGADQDGKASRYIARSTAAALTGPTGDLVDGLVRAVQAIKGSGDGLSKGDITAFKRLIPGATLPGIRSLVEYLGAPAAEAATGAR